MDVLATVFAGVSSLAVAATGVIGVLVTWRKASNERTVNAAARADTRMARADERMDKMQQVIDRLRVREQVLVSYVYGLQRQIVRMGGDPQPWPRQLDDDDDEPTPGGHP